MNRIRIFGWISVATLFTGLPCWNARAQDDAYFFFDKDSGIRIPNKIGGLEVADLHEFDSEDLGWVVKFKTKKAFYHLFVYKLGIENIPSGVDSKAVKEHFSSIKNDIKKSLKSDSVTRSKFVSEKLVEVKSNSSAAKMSFLKATFQVLIVNTKEKNKKGKKEKQKTERIFRTVLYLVGSHNRFVKLRVSHDEARSKEVDEQLKKILADLAGILKEKEIQKDKASKIK